MGPTSMKTTEQTSRSTFANARMLSEGAFTPPQGDVVQTMIYVDLAGQLPPEAPEPGEGLRAPVPPQNGGLSRDFGIRSCVPLVKVT